VAAIAKGMGGGFPIGAFMPTESGGRHGAGTHGSTYGGNRWHGRRQSVLDVILGRAIIGWRGGARPEYLKGSCRARGEASQVYVEQRGSGFLQGLQCTPECRPATW